MKRHSSILVLGLCAVLIGCGKGSSNSSTSSSSALIDFHGQWSFIATTNSTYYVEMNLSQTGNDVSAGAQDVALFGVSSVGSGCGGTAVFSGTENGGGQILFSLVESGPVGTGTTSGTLSVLDPSDTRLDGPLSSPSSTPCGIGSMGGTGNGSVQITGVRIGPFAGTFSGTLNGNPTTLTIVEGAGNTVTISGQTNMSPVSLSGNVIGASFDAKGTVSGSPAEYIGLAKTTS